MAKSQFTYVGSSGVTLPVDAPPLSDKTLPPPPPPLKLFVSLTAFFCAPLQLFAPLWSKKSAPQIFFTLTELNWTGEYTNKALFLVRGPKIQENSTPLSYATAVVGSYTNVVFYIRGLLFCRWHTVPTCSRILS